MEKAPNPSPGEIAQNNLKTLLLEGVPFDGQIAEKGLETAFTACFSELSPEELYRTFADYSERLAEKAQTSGASSFAQAFGEKADNFKRTLAVVSSQPSTAPPTPEKPTTKVARTAKVERRSSPTKTGALPAMTSAKK